MQHRWAAFEAAIMAWDYQRACNKDLPAGPDSIEMAKVHASLEYSRFAAHVMPGKPENAVVFYQDTSGKWLSKADLDAAYAAAQGVYEKVRYMTASSIIGIYESKLKG